MKRREHIFKAVCGTGRAQAAALAYSSLSLLLLLVLFPQQIYAQVALRGVRAAEFHPGSSGQLILIGNGFKSVRSVESIKLEQYRTKLLSWDVISDRRINTNIRLPNHILPDIYDVVVQFKGDDFSRSLKAKINQQLPPLLMLKAGGKILDLAEPLDFTFESTRRGQQQLLRFEMLNDGDRPLVLDSLRISPQFKLAGPFPEVVKPGRPTNFYLQVDAKIPGEKIGSISFRTNDPDRKRISMGLSASIHPLPLPRLALFVDGMPVEKKDSLQMRLPEMANTAGSRRLMITLENRDSLDFWPVIKDLPPGLKVTGRLPEMIAAGAADSFEIHFSGEDLSEKGADLKLHLNDNLQPLLLHYEPRQPVDTSPGIVSDTNPPRPAIVPPERPPVEEVDPRAGGAGKFIYVNGQPLSAWRDNPLEFAAGWYSRRATRTLSLQNRNVDTLRVTAIDLPPGFFLTGRLPYHLPPGEIMVLKIEYRAEPAEARSGKIGIIFSDESKPGAEINVQGRVKAFSLAEIPPGIIILLTLVAIGLVYLLIHGLPGKPIARLSEKIKYKLAGPDVRFHTKMDYGQQRLNSAGSSELKFELRIRPKIDYGRSEILPASGSAEDSTPAADDLTQIEGVGPVINKVLQDAGIVTFSSLAGQGAGRLNKILRQAGIHMADPASWPRQAGLAASGQWEKLQAFQGKLYAGRYGRPPARHKKRRLADQSK